MREKNNHFMGDNIPTYFIFGTIDAVLEMKLN